MFRDLKPLLESGRSVCVNKVEETALTCEQVLQTSPWPSLAGRLVTRGEQAEWGGLFAKGARYLTSSAYTDKTIGPRSYVFADPDDALGIERCFMTIWQVTSIAKRGSGKPTDPQGRKLGVPVLGAKLILVIQLREGKELSPQRAWSFPLEQAAKKRND